MFGQGVTMVVRAWVVTALFLVLSWPVLASAETIDTGEGLKFSVPDGWAKKSSGKSSVARLGSKEVEDAQIELRVAKVTADKSEQFFTTFHASLLNAGMKKIKEGDNASVKDVKARETEYSAKKKGIEFRLFVVQFQKDGKAWLVVGMFPAKKRDRLYGSLTALLGAFIFG